MNPTVCHFVLQHATAQHWNHSQRNKERRDQRKGDGPGLLTKEFSCGAVQVDNWYEDNNGRQGLTCNGASNLSCPQD